MNFYSFCIGAVRTLLFPVFRVRTKGTENVPASGPVMLAFNHRSNLDPVMAGITCPRQLNFMAKSELFKNKFFGSLITKLGAFPVHRGRGDIGAFKTAINIFRNEGAMLIFPEGGRVKPGKKSSAKPGVSVIASKCGVPVVPVHIIGEYKWMRKITVVYGEPMDFMQYKGQKLSGEELQELADGVLKNIYDLTV